MNSILTSIKKLLGIAEEYEAFDNDLIMLINSVFPILAQIGIGPEEGFMIEDDTATWSDYIYDELRLESVKTFIYLKVKLLFDPPTSSSVIESINNTLRELEWRLMITVDSPLNDK